MAQLERILASSEFETRKRLGQFLRYVVEQALNGRTDRIKQYTIAVDALGYEDDFDPQSNPAVRILARRLRRTLDHYYLSRGASDPIRIDIPKGGYRPVFVETQSAIITSAAYESPSGQPVRTTPDSSNPTIAVAMFESLDENPDNTFLAMGLTGEILIALTRFSSLSVLGPLNQEGFEIGELCNISHECGARFVLQGWIRSQGSKIRVTTNLTDTLTQRKQWGRTFDYDMEKTPLFEIEDEVTSQIAGVVADGLGIIFRKLQSESYQKHIKFSDVTQAVLTYNNAWITHSPQDWERANSAVQRALASHPENALMIALQSNIYYADLLHELNMVPDALSKMEPLANKAISLDPELQIAQYNLVPQSAFFGRVGRCIEAAEKVVEMNPNHARILSGCAVATTSVGAYDLGWNLIERAKRLNPHYPGWYHLINYWVYFGNRQYDKAWTEAQRVHVEGLFWHPLFRASILGKLGRIEEAKAYIDELLAIKPEFPKRPKEYIRLLFVIDKHVEMIWDGLHKAGMRQVE